MRTLIATMIVCCSAIGYTQEVETPPAEITTTEEGSPEVATNVGTDQKIEMLVNSGCGCGTKPKK
jgi:hypothetical protein